MEGNITDEERLKNCRLLLKQARQIVVLWEKREQELLGRIANGIPTQIMQSSSQGEAR